MAKTLSLFLLWFFLFFSTLVAADETDNAFDSARFLTQATFGPTASDIAHLQGLSSFNSWLDEQFNKTASLQESYVRERCPFVVNDLDECLYDTWVPSRHDQWWINIIENEDQLRQRVAFALSQIFVVSDRIPALSGSQFGMASYYDMLTENAFGNYRTLLEKVTLHPIMGIYLSMIRNQKADPDRNIRPDENYAREVLQLFSIGVHKLNIDGSLQLDTNSYPIPTYNQETITNFARIFTGWNFSNLDWDDHSYRADRTASLTAFEAYHDTNSKILLDGVYAAAGNTAAQDLSMALDNIFYHPNVGPFISKQLIQRLVTSNPSPDYIARVATVFNDTGNPSGRGDLKAVIKAILLDTEARSGHLNMPETFGKLREPVLRLSHLARVFSAEKKDGGEWNGYPGTYVYRFGVNTYDTEGSIGQGMLRSPSVFNFYRPDHSPAGEIRDNVMVAPEFEILNENTLATLTNISNHMLRVDSDNDWISSIDLSVQLALVSDSNALLDNLNLLLLSGQMSPDLRTILSDHINANQWWGNTQAERDIAKVRDIIALILMSPDYLIQK